MKKLFYLVGFLLMMSTQAKAQNNNPQYYMRIPPLDTIIGYHNARVSSGYWFVAPTDFTITCLQEDTQMYPPVVAQQPFEVVKIHHLVTYPDTGWIFEVLFYGIQYHLANPRECLTVNIPIQAGDTIGVLGNFSGSIGYTDNKAPYIAHIANDSMLLYPFSSASGYLMDDSISYYMANKPINRLGRVGLWYRKEGYNPSDTSGGGPDTSSTDTSSTGIFWLGRSPTNPILFPNPSEKILSLKNLKQTTSFVVTNAVGKVLLQGKVGPRKKDIDISGLSPGTYFLKLKGKHRELHYKFVKR